jgi:cytochrome P450
MAAMTQPTPTPARAPRVAGPTGRAAVTSWRRLLRDPLDGFVALAQEYGGAVRLPYTRNRAVFLLSRPEHAEHVFVSAEANFRKAFTYRPLRAVLGDGLLTSDGETWRAHRRIVQPVFARRHLDSFVPGITDVTARRISGWQDGEVVDAAAEMRRLALDVVGRVLFGADLADEAEPLGVALTRLQAGNLIGAGVALLPGRAGDAALRAARHLPPLAASVRLLDELVDRMVRERRAAPGAEGSPNLLDLLIAGAHGPGGLSDAELHDEVLTLVLAGHETTAAALTWTLARLALHPDVRADVEAEVDEVLAGRVPAAGDVDELVLTRAVLQESMRLHPPAWTIERAAVEDDEVAGVPVPAGSTVGVPPYLLHRWPDLWPDPERFDPARFLGQHDRPRHAYLPFGAGRRICVGAGFATMEATLVLAMLAQRHRLDLLDGQLPRGRAEVTYRPVGRVRMRVTRRT